MSPRTSKAGRPMLCAGLVLALSAASPRGEAPADASSPGAVVPLFNVKDLSALVVRSKLLSTDYLTGALRALKPTGTDAADIESARRLLVAGKHLTEGTPVEVARNPAVIEAYLGDVA